MRNKSKIEKLKGKYYIYPKNSKDEVVEYLNALCEKQNEIIDHLNSQAQPEVLPVEGDEFEYNGEKYKWGKTYTSKDTPEESSVEDWKKTYGVERAISSDELKVKQDTPEEWEERFEGLWFEEEDCNGAVKAEPIRGFIKQLLDEREREVLERLLEKRSRLPFTENWLVWVTHITRELNKLDGKKQ